MNTPGRIALIVASGVTAAVILVGGVIVVGLAATTSGHGSSAGAVALARAVPSRPEVTASSAPTPSPGAKGRHGWPRGPRGTGASAFPGPGGGRWGGGMWGAGVGRGGLLHGEFAVNGAHGPQTVLVQRGTVTAVSTASVSLRSTDGYTATYRVTSDTKIWSGHGTATISAVKTGSEAFVTAQKSATASATATVLAVQN